MDLDGFFGSNPIPIDLRAKSKQEAMDELIAHLMAVHKIRAEHKDSILGAIHTGESAMSTGIGFGIALPHASSDLVTNVIVAIGRSRTGIPFGSLDAKPVHLIALFLVPAGEFQKHTDILAALAKLLHRDDFRDGLWRRFM